MKHAAVEEAKTAKHTRHTELNPSGIMKLYKKITIDPKHQPRFHVDLNIHELTDE